MKLQAETYILRIRWGLKYLITKGNSYAFYIVILSVGAVSFNNQSTTIDMLACYQPENLEILTRPVL